MRTSFRITTRLLNEIRNDLSRPHPFASERVGFLSVAQGSTEDETHLILGVQYHPIPDNNYINDPGVGARIDSSAILEALQRIKDTNLGCFHVHAHPWSGVPRLSKVDRREIPPLVKSMAVVGTESTTHGVLVMSPDNGYAEVWNSRSSSLAAVDQIKIIGRPLQTYGVIDKSNATGERFSRQSFLGEAGQAAIEAAVIGIIGLGGGGSHIVQQLAHLGVRRFRLFDPQTIEESNLNRMVGATVNDVEVSTPKLEIARRVIRSITPDAEAIGYSEVWQNHADVIHGCDIVFGCVDTFIGRRDLEVTCRRYLIPYIDIGMDVHQVMGDSPRMAGQIILSMPDESCMFCFDFLNDSVLAQEGTRYGDAGGRPQVIWSNGVLASSAVGLAVDLLTGWSGRRRPAAYLSYDGDACLVGPHPQYQLRSSKGCIHYTSQDIGDPIWRKN